MSRALSAGALALLACVTGCSAGGGDGGRDCTAGATCVPANPCHLGAIDCSGGSASCIDTGAVAPDDVGCGSGSVCASGACVPACVAGQACTPGEACRTGSTACASASATPTCPARANLPDGTACGSGWVCREGSCVTPCAADQPCQPANPCVTGATACASSTAEPTCVTSGNRPDGTACAAASACVSGTCTAIEVPTIASFTATPTNVPPGGVVSLAWAATPGAALSIAPGVGPVAGTGVVVTPAATTTYVLTATNAFGETSASATVTVSEVATVAVRDATVPARRRVALEAVVTVAAGDPDLRVDWSVEGGAANGTVDPTRGTGTEFTAPEAPGTYRVWATSVWEPAKRGSGVVTVTPAPNAWRPLAPLDVPRMALAVVAAGDKVYAIGGRTWYMPGGHEYVTVAPVGDVEEYDPALDRWIPRADLPTPRAFPSAVALGGRIYCIGGFDASGVATTAVEVFDPATDRWERKAPVPSAAAAAVVLNGQLYLFAGDGDPLRLYAYDADADAWHLESAYTSEYNFGPLLFSAATTAGRLFRTPGERTRLGYHAGFDRWVSYEPAAMAWSVPRPMNVPRSLFGVAGLGGSVYALGGDRVRDFDDPDAPSPSDLADVEAFSVALDAWIPRASMPFARRELGATVLGGRVIAAGGVGCAGSLCQSLDAVQEYTPPAAPSGPNPMTIFVGSKPFGLLHDGTSVWVANTESGTVTKIRPDDGKVLATVTVGAQPKGSMAFDGTHVWVTNTGANTVSRIRASDGVVSTFPAGPGPHGVAFDGRDVWVANFDGGSVSRLSGPNGYVMATYPVGPQPNGVAFDGSDIWVSRPGAVSRLSRDTGAVAASYTGAFDPYGLIADGSFWSGGVWFADNGGSTVRHLRNDASLASSYTVGSRPLALALVGPVLWVTNAGSATVTKLRVSDGAVLSTTAVPGTPYGVAFDGESTWVTDHAGHAVTRFR